MPCSPFARVATVLVVAALSFSLAACQAEGGANPEGAATSTPDSAPSPSQSLTPSPADPKSTGIEGRAADAEARYREYMEISSRYGKKSKNPFEELLNKGYLGNAETQDYEESYWKQFTDLGLKETGEARLESVDVTDYDGDPLQADITGHRVHLDICLDNRKWNVIRPDGSSAIEPDRPVKFEIKVVMQGQPSGLWSIAENKYTKTEC